MKFCKDCKFISNVDLPNPTCYHPNNLEVSPVNGNEYWKKNAIEYCFTHREYGRVWSYLINACGKEGKWYEPKDADS